MKVFLRRGEADLSSLKAINLLLKVVSGYPHNWNTLEQLDYRVSDEADWTVAVRAMLDLHKNRLWVIDRFMVVIASWAWIFSGEDHVPSLQG